MKLQSTTLFSAFSTIAVALAIVTGIFVIGSPSDIRERRFDEKRAADLAAISTAIRIYRNTHEGVPQHLNDLLQSSPTVAHVRLKDPTGRPYEYKVKDSSSYELCAEFDTATDRSTDREVFRSTFEKHGVGRQCFSREARPPVRR